MKEAGSGCVGIATGPVPFWERKEVSHGRAEGGSAMDAHGRASFAHHDTGIGLWNCVENTPLSQQRPRMGADRGSRNCGAKIHVSSAECAELTWGTCDLLLHFAAY